MHAGAGFTNDQLLGKDSCPAAQDVIMTSVAPRDDHSKGDGIARSAPEDIRLDIEDLVSGDSNDGIEVIGMSSAACGDLPNCSFEGIEIGRVKKLKSGRDEARHLAGRVASGDAEGVEASDAPHGTLSTSLKGTTAGAQGLKWALVSSYRRGSMQERRKRQLKQVFLRGDNIVLVNPVTV